MCQLPLYSLFSLLPLLQLRGDVSYRTSQKQSPQIGSPQRAASVHLEETQFNQLSHHLSALYPFYNLHLHIDS